MTRNHDTATCNTPNPTDTRTRLMKATEVATHLQVSLATVYRLMSSRTLPTVRLGRCIRVPYNDLVQWISARTQSAILD